MWKPRLMVRGLGIALILSAAFAATRANVEAQEQASFRQFALRAESPQFWELFDRDAKLATVAGGFGFTEGPVWDEQGYVWVSDETLNKILRVYSDGHREEMISLGDPDGNTYDQQHRLLDCASVLRAIIRLSPDGKSYEIVADRYDGKKFNSPNDVVLGPDGAIYFTDPTLDLIVTQNVRF
jgi:gluconolactonase